MIVHVERVLGKVMIWSSSTLSAESMLVAMIALQSMESWLREVR